MPEEGPVDTDGGGFVEWRMSCRGANHRNWKRLFEEVTGYPPGTPQDCGVGGEPADPQNVLEHPIRGEALIPRVQRRYLDEPNDVFIRAFKWCIRWMDRTGTRGHRWCLDLKSFIRSRVDSFIASSPPVRPPICPDKQ